MNQARRDNSAGASFSPLAFTHFRYDSFTAEQGSAELSFAFSLVGDHTLTFTERVTLPQPVRETREILPVAKLLWLAMGLSYYKAAVPPSIIVPRGLTAPEHRFLSELLAGGLGEFAYRNNLPQALAPTIVADQITAENHGPFLDPEARPMIAVGGGKDSVVSIELCKAGGLNPLTWSVNQYAAITRCVQASSCDYVSSSRIIDPALFEANRRGAYNGHIPVTAINSLIGLLTSHVMGAGPVVMSNEQSANYGNLLWEGHVVNHQWSKSLSFENLLRSCLEDSYQGAAPYFSFLRPLTELQIAERFSAYPQYFPAFTSCNRAFILDKEKRAIHWCCQCPKCLFVFLILAPWLSPDVLLSIFGTNILDEPANEPLMSEILGYQGYKPFECVGDVAEARQALRQVAAQEQWQPYSLVRSLAPRLADFADPPEFLSDDLVANIPPTYLALLNL